jgi:hypothetical protein
MARNPYDFFTIKGKKEDHKLSDQAYPDAILMITIISVGIQITFFLESEVIQNASPPVLLKALTGLNIAISAFCWFIMRYYKKWVMSRMWK